jgi:hypothetical protein
MSRSIIPWSDLNLREKRNFQTFLWEHGLRVDLDEASDYYGNREKVERDAPEEIDDSVKWNCPNCFGPLTAVAIIEAAGECVHCGHDLVDRPGEGP